VLLSDVLDLAEEVCVYDLVFPGNKTKTSAKIEVMKVMQMMKQRAKAEVTPIPTIYEEELIKLRTPESNDDTRQIIEQLPTYYSCKTALYHQRSLNISL
jgi:predicted type IV restriction endonuclease